MLERILAGRNVRRAHHDPRPTLTIWAPLSPGDFLDRFAVLTAKRSRFDPDRRSQIEREYHRFRVIYEQTTWPPEIDAYLTMFVDLHLATFDLFERMVPASLDHLYIAQDDHISAIHLNRKRTILKNAVDTICHGPYTEVKSYHGRDRQPQDRTR